MRQLILIFLALLLITSTATAATLTVDDSGGKQYKTIQSAVNAAKTGDTIYVYAGTYPETVTIRDKTLTFQGEKASTGYKYPTVYGFYFGWTEYNAGAGNVNGFKITDSGIEYNVIGSNTVRNNYFNGCGVDCSGQVCSNNIIKNNQFYKGGIALWESYDNEITGNKFSYAPVGLSLREGASCTTISGNTFSYCNVGVQVYSIPSYLTGNTYVKNKINIQTGVE